MANDGTGTTKASAMPGIPNASSLEVTSTDVFLMGRGEWFKAQEKLGAHLAYRIDPATGEAVFGCFFAVWVPGAAAVHVTGGFCDWDPDAHALSCTETGGIWQGFVDGVAEGVSYKFVIDTAGGERLFKADPYAFRSEHPPETASVVFDLTGFPWMDGDWLAARAKTDHFKRPLNIYEVHLGSWMRHADGLSGFGLEPQGERDAGGSYLTYEELAKALVPYVRDMGYTHVELLPVMEHPFDGSWGYQTTAYFAPTSRFGDPKGFMHLVDAFHQAGIGVILDWVPGGFCRDAHGLAAFNGSMLYEHEEHPTWGTLKFDFGRGEVRSFLISNALFWLETYHADGLRVDGVSSILYLNFALPDGEPRRTNSQGGEEDLEAVAFLRSLNTTVSAYHPDVMCIAEESTAWPLVTYPPSEGGLGFHYKWDLGWMNDTLRYMQTDFPFRPGVHRLLTFSMMYAFNENFVLPLSHDEVVHGKLSLIGRMPGDYWRTFAGMRALMAYQMLHPGAKLSFMGNEIAQYIEWRYYEGIEWFLAKDYDAHRKHREFIKALNHLYTAEPALWQRSFSWDGFEWVNANDSAQSLISFVRKGDDPEDELVVVLNFDVASYESFRVGVPRRGVYREIFNSDAEAFGGSGILNGNEIPSRDEECDGLDTSVLIRVPALACVVLKREAGKEPPRMEARASATPSKRKRDRTRAGSGTARRSADAHPGNDGR